MSGSRFFVAGLGKVEVGLIASALLLFGWIGFRALGPEGRITFADRPRTSAVTPDFLMRYLDATGTEYGFDHGFITLAKSDETHDKLRGLLSALGTYIDVMHEDRSAVIARRGTMTSEAPTMIERRTAEPTDDGRLAITTQLVEWNDHTWHEFDQLLLSLESQYREVAEALRTIDPGFVVPDRYTPAEPVRLASRPTAVSQKTRRSGTARFGEIIELSERQGQERARLPVSQQRALGN